MPCPGKPVNGNMPCVGRFVVDLSMLHILIVYSSKGSEIFSNFFGDESFCTFTLVYIHPSRK